MHTYKKSQTTSTKCQYHAAASNPKWWWLEKWWLSNRKKHTARKVVPIITCNPWNPVATKKVEPYTLSAIVKGASRYSHACRAVKYSPRITVNPSACTASPRFFSIILWWAQVIVAPEDSNTAVFSKGTRNGFSASIPVGGHETPISTVGASLLWKNAQKKAKKKQTSDVMNNIIPYRKPLITTRVWCPWNVASRTTSRHHLIAVTVVASIPIMNKVIVPKWNHTTKPEVIMRAPKAAVSGHGLWSTRWKGCWWVIPEM